MNSWFRFYFDTVDNPKAQKLPDALFKTWINLLCIAGKHDGHLPAVEDVAWILRVPTEQLGAMLQELVRRELFDEVDGVLIPHDWDERQMKTDSAAERMRAYRARRSPPLRNATVTRDVTVTAQEETQNRVEKKDSRAIALVPKVDRKAIGEQAAELFDRFWNAYPKRGGSNPKVPAAKKFLALAVRGDKLDTEGAEIVIAAAERYAEACRKDLSAGTKFVAQAVTWLNQQRWSDYGLGSTAIPVAFKRPDDAPPEDPRWIEVKAKIAKSIGADKVASWLDPLEFEGIDGGGVKLRAPSLFHRNHVIQHYGDAIFEAWQAIEPDALKLLIGNKKAAA